MDRCGGDPRLSRLRQELCCPMRGSVKGSASFAQHSTLIPTPELPCLREADAWGHCPNVENDLSHDQSKKGWWTCPGSPVKCRAKKQTPPLTILGVERNAVFLFGADWTAGTFNFFGSLLGGLLMFAVLFLSARWATARDPQLLRILLNASRFKPRYDPAKRAISLGKGSSQ